MSPRAQTPGQRALAPDRVGWVDPANGPESPDRSTALRALADQARAIATAQDNADAAWKEERTARVDLLNAVVDAIRPALRACSSRIAIRFTKSKAGTTHEHHDQPGIYIATTWPEPKKLPGPGPLKATGPRGRYSGTDLFLLGDGSWMEMVYDGAWSIDSDAVCQWAGARMLNVATADVIDQYDANAIITTLADVLARQAESARDRRTVQWREEAERLRALAKLLRA